MTVTVTVLEPVVAYVWDRDPSVQEAVQTAFVVLPDTVNASFGDPSPQFTVTDQEASAPGSVKDPSEKLADWLCVAVWFAPAVTVGLTFWTEMPRVPVPESPGLSSSVPTMLTLVEEGPFRNRQRNRCWAGMF